MNTGEPKALIDRFVKFQTLAKPPRLEFSVSRNG